MRYKHFSILDLKRYLTNGLNAADLTEDEARRLLLPIMYQVVNGIADLVQNWDKAELEEWGLELDWPADISIGTDEFILPDGDKSTFSTNDIYNLQTNKPNK